ncbi:MAG TPA: nitroreductase/quinone reductase family protein [Candidatus Dormibacteraeota bacterium]|nr:nitroreductase/quinone reductase family protein [Candidatus Dormibacteraeota bacterium]
MATATRTDHAVRLPPRWFIRAFWVVQRAIYRISGRTLQRASAGKQGMLALRTTGRRSGAERLAIVGYFEDGPNLVTMAMNGWGEAEPAWWLNLQAHPDATVELVEGPRHVHARAAIGDERRRLWDRWASYDEGLDQYAAMRSHETAVVILEPRSDHSA